MMNDITGAEVVQIVIRDDSKVLWVNTEKGCVLRICEIKKIVLEDKRKHAKKEKKVRKARREGVSTRRNKNDVKA